MRASKSPNSRYQQDIILKYLQKGSVVVDVRSKYEYDRGHVNNSILMGMPITEEKIEHIKALEASIITVCTSGVRSKQITDYLQKKGIDSINGGSWQNVAQLIGQEDIRY